MSLNNYAFAQAGTLWVIADGTPAADVNLTLSLENYSEIFAPYTIRSGVIASLRDDTYSELIVFACDSMGNTLPNSAVPLAKLSLGTGGNGENAISAYVAFSNGAGTNVAGFGIQLCVWSTDSSLKNGSTISMDFECGQLDAYSAKFGFQTRNGGVWGGAFSLQSGDNSVPWGTGQGTATGLTQPPRDGK